MKFVEFNPVDEKGNCILRSLTKILNKDYYKVKEEILNLAKELGYNDYREETVFETYLKLNNINEIKLENNTKIKDLDLQGKYAIFCWDKKDFYHMVTVIDNVLYDKNSDSLELYVIKIYKEN